MRMQVTAVLETREILNPAAVHPSRKNSSTITKVNKFFYYPFFSRCQRDEKKFHPVP
jgi:hypothetical protein